MCYSIDFNRDFGQAVVGSRKGSKAETAIFFRVKDVEFPLDRSNLS
jgi:hypothetical protein